TLVVPDVTSSGNPHTMSLRDCSSDASPSDLTPGVTPSGPDLTGTYQWNATYSGDDNNNAASDIDDPTEQVTVNPDSPTLSTTPDQTSVTLGPAVTLHDAAFLQAGFNPTGSFTFTLVGPDGTTVVDTEVVMVSG